jgi:hypothetical protein
MRVETASTAFALVKTIQSYRPRSASAASSGRGSEGGRNSMRGTSEAIAPRDASPAMSSGQWRVTSTRRPLRVTT